MLESTDVHNTNIYTFGIALVIENALLFKKKSFLFVLNFLGKSRIGCINSMCRKSSLHTLEDDISLLDCRWVDVK